MTIRETLNNEHIRRAAATAYFLLIAVAVWASFRGRWHEIGDDFRNLKPFWLAAAVLSSAAATWLSMIVYRLLLLSAGATIGLRPASEIFFIGQAGKYLPGSLWPALVQSELGVRHNLSRTINVSAVFVSMILSIIVGSATGAAFLVVVDPARWFWVFLALFTVAVVAVVALFAWPAPARWLPSFLRQRLPEGQLLRAPIAWSVALLVLTWIFHGLQIAALTKAVGLDRPDLVATSIGAFALAFAGGFLFVIAPAGAGIREAIMVGVLGGSDWRDAASIVVLSRLVLLVVDLGFAFGGLWSAGGLARLASRRSPIDDGRSDETGGKEKGVQRSGTPPSD